MLAFAFLATFGFNGLVTIFLHDVARPRHLRDGAWIYDCRASPLVYTYFQIPLMVIVFLPALDGLRPEWRERAESLGGTAWSFWRHIGGPDPRAELPRCDAAAVRERLLRLCHGRGAGQPGKPDRAAADPRRVDQRDRSWARRTSARRWPSA